MAKYYVHEIPEGYGVRIEGNKVIIELREGDSDRIRKEIISALKWANHRGVYDEHIAYLEQQEEQKSLNISAASEWLRKHISNYMNSEYNEFHKCVEYDGSIDKERLINDFEEAMQKEQSLRDFIDDFPYSCEQEEQKPINESNMHEPTLDEARKWNEAYEKGYSLGYENGRNEQKPVEWGKEDEEIRQALIEFLREAYSRGNAPEECAKWLVWLDRPKEQKPAEVIKDQRQIAFMIEDGRRSGVIEGRKQVIDNPEQYGLQKPVSQEECNDGKSILEDIIVFVSGYADKRVVAKWVSFLKSLRSQPKQEWSEEDKLHYVNVLEALEYVKGCKSDYDKIEAIISDIAWFKSIRPQPKRETE